MLEGQLTLFEFFYDCEEMEAWIYEKWLLVQAASLGRDLSQIQQAIQKHKVCLKKIINKTQNEHKNVNSRTQLY